MVDPCRYGAAPARVRPRRVFVVLMLAAVLACGPSVGDRRGSTTTTTSSGSTAGPAGVSTLPAASGESNSGATVSSGSAESTTGGASQCNPTSWSDCPPVACQNDECGVDRRFDENGCARERCSSASDCRRGESCQDLVACTRECVVTIDSCEVHPLDGECSCLGNDTCLEALRLCFGPGEYSCGG